MTYLETDRRGKQKQSMQALTLNTPEIPRNNYTLIIADPPWQYSLRETDKSHRGRTPYPNMADADILNLPINAISASSAYCLLWVTNNHLELGLQCLAAWGFAYKTTHTWIKTTKAGKPKIGLGHYGRSCTEHFLIGCKGKPKSFTTLGLTNIPNVIFEAPREHSCKPEQFYGVAERLSVALPGPTIELFARKQSVAGWDYWGAECNSLAS